MLGYSTGETYAASSVIVTYAVHIQVMSDNPRRCGWNEKRTLRVGTLKKGQCTSVVSRT